MLKLYRSQVICMKKNTDPITSVRRAAHFYTISSLPGEYGVGTMGKEAREFADFLKKSGFSYWQILPLVQTGMGDSPYQSVFAASGNPLFIDPDVPCGKGTCHKSGRRRKTKSKTTERRTTGSVRKAFFASSQGVCPL